MKFLKYHADLIITNTGEPLKNSCILCDENGKVISFEQCTPDSTMQSFKGVICPGFVNAHCHLELSHLKGIIPSGTGLIEFIKDVVGKRNISKEIIDDAIQQADREMYQNGIVAVGDICNQSDTAEAKKNSRLAYCSFVELFDFLQDDQAKATIEDHLTVWHDMPESDSHKKFMVPHASYSVSKSLFDRIKSFNKAPSIISIHNQELTAENDLFLSKEGLFIDFYKQFGISLDGFQATGRTAIYYVLNNLKNTDTNIFVHNTQTTEEEIQAAHTFNSNTYWVTCPNANLYIENTLPDYRRFINQQAKMCIGTDSLGSNWQLNILEELITIKKYQSYLDDTQLIGWATSNGAKALGYEDCYGSISLGKSPGLVYIDVPVSQEGKFDLRMAKSVNRII